MTQARMTDGTGVLTATWFNAPYAEKMLRGAEDFILFGKVSFRGRIPEMINPVTENQERAGSKTGKIIPVYPCTAGLSQRHIRDAVQNALELLTEPMPDVLPPPIREAYSLMPVERAIRQVHEPDDFDTFEEARRRLAFEEFFILQIGIGMVKEQRACRQGAPV